MVNVSTRKGLKIGRALKSAARLPGRVSHGRGSGRNNLKPITGELPVVMLRVRIEGCKNLLPRDKNGLSDPFVAVSFLRRREQTTVAKRTLNPVYPAGDATFDFPIFLSLGDKLGVLELVIWDKDMLRKEYVGEVSLPLEEWFKDGCALDFNDPKNVPFSIPVLSTRASIPATGTMHVKLGFVKPSARAHSMSFEEVYEELLRRSHAATMSLVSAPPTEGIGTIRSNLIGPEYEDDGLSSDEGEPDYDEDPVIRDFFSSSTPQEPLTLRDPASPVYDEPEALSVQTPQRPTVSQITTASRQSTMRGQPPPSPQTPTDALTPVAPAPKSSGFIPRMKFPRRASSTPPNVTPSTSGMIVAPAPSQPRTPPEQPTTPTAKREGSTPPPRPSFAPQSTEKRKIFRKSWAHNKLNDYNFSAAPNDILGIVMLEICSATDLPKLRNMTRLGWDMDPFVVVSCGKKVFRTRVVRHSLNPTWDEKMLFHVRRYETNFKVQLTVLDWDKLSSNDYVGDAHFDLAEVMNDAPQRDEQTGLYPDEVDGSHEMKTLQLPITTVREMPWGGKHTPAINIRAKYQPYDALRQRFWRQCLKQYDTDDTGHFSQLEISSMLDSLGSTLSKETIETFFSRRGKPTTEELTTNEVIQCLEEELSRPKSEKRRISLEESPPFPDTSAPVTPNYFPEHENRYFSLDQLDFSGQTANSHGMKPMDDLVKKPTLPPAHPTEPSERPLIDVTAPTLEVPPNTLGPSRPSPIGRESSASSSDAEESSGSTPDEGFERVINIKNCPLCHRPRLKKKSEVDIVTHLAICASQDWERVDRIVVGNFVTASQAQRKWYTKVISKVSRGNYSLGANSANIIVQNRLTGHLEEEKMQAYIRLGIRLFYKGAKSRMEGARARRLLKSLSYKQGQKYDSPLSAREIPTFVMFHNLNVDEILEPLGSYKTFNEFFYRKLKPGARPLESPEDPSRVVSCADCRLMTFETVSEATRLWIKGREFSVQRLLGEAYKDDAERYMGGALAVFRLAPQDYHRFHSPVDGTVGKMTYISGEYYTVNPQAVRTALDVFGENVRKIIPIDSPTFGKVMAVCVGAMMVGSIHTTVEEGEGVTRGQELGYFAFGGSTIVVLFGKGVLDWDEDLLINGRACLETLVRVGTGIGRRRKPPAPRRNSSHPI